MSNKKISSIKATLVGQESEVETFIVNDPNAVKFIKMNGINNYPSNGCVDLDSDYIKFLNSYNYLTKKVIEIGEDLNDEDLNETTIIAVKEHEENYEEDSKLPSDYGPAYSLFFYKEGKLHRLTAPLPKAERDDIDFFSSRFNNFPNFKNFAALENYFNNDINESTLTPIIIDESTIEKYFIINTDTNPQRYGFVTYIVYYKDNEIVKHYVTKTGDYAYNTYKSEEKSIIKTSGYKTPDDFAKSISAPLN